MIKKIIFLMITTTQVTLWGALTSTHWKTITVDIARDGDAQSRGEFEAARQAFLHIKDESEAKIAAKAIEKKWKSTWPVEASVGNVWKDNTLMSLIRYPLMTKKQARAATEKLLNNSKVAQFFEEQHLKVSELGKKP